MHIVFIEKAFVMKIILLIKILAGVGLCSHAQLAQIKRSGNSFPGDITWLSQK